MYKTLLLFLLTFFVFKSDAQSVYKTAYTFIGKTKNAIIQVKGFNYELDNYGGIFYEFKNPTGIKPGTIGYSFNDDICFGMVMFYNPNQMDAVTGYLNKMFSFQEVKIPGTEFYTKLWVETENTGRYTWNITDKGNVFFLSLLFYKK